MLKVVKKTINFEDLKIKFLECSNNKEFLDLLINSKHENNIKFIENLYNSVKYQ